MQEEQQKGAETRRLRSDGIRGETSLHDVTPATA